MLYKPLQYFGPFGNQLSSSADTKEGYQNQIYGRDELHDWGNPQLQQMVPENEGPVLRGQLPKWAPGEFEEWKHAKMTGTPTRYGLQRQRSLPFAYMRGVTFTNRTPDISPNRWLNNDPLGKENPSTIALHLLRGGR